MTDANAKVIWYRQNSVRTPPPPDYSEECERIDCRFNRNTLGHLLEEPGKSASANIAGWCFIILGWLCVLAVLVSR